MWSVFFSFLSATQVRFANMLSLTLSWIEFSVRSLIDDLQRHTVKVIRSIDSINVQHGTCMCNPCVGEMSRSSVKRTFSFIAAVTDV